MNFYRVRQRFTAQRLDNVARAVRAELIPFPIAAGNRIAIAGGSAYGIGLADVTTRRLVEKTDWNVTNANVAVSGFTERGKLPHVAETDEEALEFALAGNINARIVRIKNTLHLETLLVSENVLKEIQGREVIEVLEPVTGFFTSF